ncbi:flagellar hook protein FlgE [Amaricoccus sp.]|uniref:flagellar hook protein FlgE n=1 Tax=Amaricoccus sp. TaxID=1872485 RepID=UPI001B59638E|nr:flagellar hook-basal body complex protein [Amaricoccus sp.]MBP7241149.1 flagellar hook-basal body complex protein [Amaricoccus sp.]
MGISSSMNAGVSGLNANANKLATISDNIANSQTYGYKRADVDFASMAVSDSRTPYTAGGGRWFTAGGVRTNAIWDIDAKGALASTANATDIAITGRGMLPVTTLSSMTNIGAAPSDPDFFLTSTGSFEADADGYLRSPSGLVLMGWPADLNGNIPPQPRDSAAGLAPIQINRSSFAAQPTSTITLNANLPATETQAGSAGTALPVNVEYFDNLGASQTLAMSFTPVVPATGQSNTWTMTITDQASGLSGGTYQIVFSDTPPTAGAIASVTQTVAPTAPLTSAYNAATGDLALDLGAQPIAIQLGAPGGGANQHLSQLSSTFSPVGVTKDGSPAGTFTGVTIDENGLMRASYSSGFTRVVYQVPVVDVPNFNGLRVLDNQTFGLSDMSGSMFLWDAGDGPTGAIQGFAREQSTTDIAQELTQLITTQRAYSSNAKIIQTVDEMLQETTNLKR